MWGWCGVEGASGVFGEEASGLLGESLGRSLLLISRLFVNLFCYFSLCVWTAVQR